MEPAIGPAVEPAVGPDCPRNVSCEWLPAVYRRLKSGGYGNHDRSDGPRKIDYIVIHDGETSYDAMTRLVKNPDYLSWHFTIRSSDGHIAQHLRARDIGWHAGNWYVNSRSVGLEHEGYLAKGGAWFTEAMYLASARLVRHLAAKYDIPLDRAHILGHDNVPGTTPETVGGMHDDPGPYWDWSHYFELLGSPLRASGGDTARSVLIKPDYGTNSPNFTGCSGGAAAWAPPRSGCTPVPPSPRPWSGISASTPPATPRTASTTTPPAPPPASGTHSPSAGTAGPRSGTSARRRGSAIPPEPPPPCPPPARW